MLDIGSTWEVLTARGSSIFSVYQRWASDLVATTPKCEPVMCKSDLYGGRHMKITTAISGGLRHSEIKE